MNQLEEYYNKFNEEKRLNSRHGQVEYRISMQYIHQYLPKDIRPEEIKILDIGAGTGSISIECARQVPFGEVHSVERDEAAIGLIEKNKEKAAEKRQKRGEKAERINAMAQANAKSIKDSAKSGNSRMTDKEREEKLAQAKKKSENAKAGSLASKANMVKKFNENN